MNKAEQTYAGGDMEAVTDELGMHRASDKTLRRTIGEQLRMADALKNLLHELNRDNLDLKMRLVDQDVQIQDLRNQRKEALKERNEAIDSLACTSRDLLAPQQQSYVVRAEKNALKLKLARARNQKGTVRRRSGKAGIR